MARSKDEQEIRRRRKVVRYSLDGVLTSGEMEAALGLWEREFRDQPAFVVSSFVQRLAGQLALGDRLREVKSRLLGNMLLSEEELVPAQPVPSAPVVQPNVVVAGSVLDVVFNGILMHATELIANRNAYTLRELRAFLLESGGGLRISDSGRECLLDWAHSTERMRAPMAPGCSEDEMKKILHILYVWACEEIGPSAADRILSSAMREAEQLPEAAKFPPRHFF